jgi:hypothetical protein
MRNLEIIDVKGENHPSDELVSFAPMQSSYCSSTLYAKIRELRDFLASEKTEPGKYFVCTNMYSVLRINNPNNLKFCMKELVLKLYEVVFGEQTQLIPVTVADNNYLLVFNGSMSPLKIEEIVTNTVRHCYGNHLRSSETIFDLDEKHKLVEQASLSMEHIRSFMTEGSKIAIDLPKVADSVNSHAFELIIARVCRIPDVLRVQYSTNKLVKKKIQSKHINELVHNMIDNCMTLQHPEQIIQMLYILDTRYHNRYCNEYKLKSIQTTVKNITQKYLESLRTKKRLRQLNIAYDNDILGVLYQLFMKISFYPGTTSTVGDVFGNTQDPTTLITVCHLYTIFDPVYDNQKCMTTTHQDKIDTMDSIINAPSVSYNNLGLLEAYTDPIRSCIRCDGTPEEMQNLLGEIISTLVVKQRELNTQMLTYLRSSSEIQKYGKKLFPESKDDSSQVKASSNTENLVARYYQVQKETNRSGADVDTVSTFTTLIESKVGYQIDKILLTLNQNIFIIVQLHGTTSQDPNVETYKTVQL